MMDQPNGTNLGGSGWSLCEKFYVRDPVTGRILFQQSLSRQHINRCAGLHLGLNEKHFDIKSEGKNCTKQSANESNNEGRY